MTPPVRNPAKGYLLVATGATFFVMNAGVSRAIQGAGVDSMTLTTVRCTGTALVLVGFLLMRGVRLPLPRGWLETISVLGLGISGVALVQWLYFVAIDRLPVGIALLLEYTAPVLVALFARVVYRERVRRRLWLGLALALTGLALVARVWAGLTLDAVGVLAGLGAAVSLAAYFLLGERGVTLQSPLVVLTQAFIVAAVFWNLVRPISALWAADLVDEPNLGGALSHVTTHLWLLFVWMILLGTVVPFLAELSALRHLTATEVTLIGMLEPIGASVLGWSWFKESLSPLQLGGIALVLAGIALAQTARMRRRVEPATPPLVG